MPFNRRRGLKSASWPLVVVAHGGGSAKRASGSAARVTKKGGHTNGDAGTPDPQTHSSGYTSAPASHVLALTIPRKRGLLRRYNGWRVHRQFQVAQDFLDDTSLGKRRNDPQPTLLTHRAAFHVNGKYSLEQPRPVPVRRGRRAFGLVHTLLARGGDDGRLQVAIRCQATAVTHLMLAR